MTLREITAIVRGMAERRGASIDTLADGAGFLVTKRFRMSIPRETVPEATVRDCLERQFDWQLQHPR